MSLKLMFITNEPMVARVAENSGVDRIWVDLEWMGKEERQLGMNTVKSNHIVSDVAKLRPCVKKAELMVRVNPLWKGSKNEIDAVVGNGVDLVMLPMFKTADDAKRYVELVDGRAKVMLLAETTEAVENLEKIVEVPGIDEIHIGLNDLHISYKLNFMFELVSNGTVDRACKIIRKTDISYGFGGLAQLGKGRLPAEYILGEHYRLGSSMAILSRSFYNACLDKQENTIEHIFSEGIKKIRGYEEMLACQDTVFFAENHEKVKTIVKQIIKGEI